MLSLTGGVPSCVYARAAVTASAYYDQTGDRVAVLMLNGFHESSEYLGEPRAVLAVRRLFCSA